MEDLFDKYWDGAKSEIFRLSLPLETYSEEQLERYESYKTTGEIPIDRELSDWFESLSELKRKGVKVIRLQIIKRPISPFTLFELKQMLLFIDNGETVLYVEEEDFNKVCGSGMKDFWLFDMSKSVEPVYGPEGKFMGYSAVKDAERMVETRNRLIEIARPIGELQDLADDHH